ncbi:hypothetical protein CDAR_495641 [Caerostris darwini]|uniref:Uncharacterized protein n=1 Tax=Caerostris darwini TaxID=1538125 RepID=A0AAV4SBP7_9ARAC|nr:hypothetical protein CDAR_495641 [Caerostris darwini]
MIARALSLPETLLILLINEIEEAISRDVMASLFLFSTTLGLLAAACNIYPYGQFAHPLEGPIGILYGICDPSKQEIKPMRYEYQNADKFGFATIGYKRKKFNRDKILD